MPAERFVSQCSIPASRRANATAARPTLEYWGRRPNRRFGSGNTSSPATGGIGPEVNENSRASRPRPGPCEVTQPMPATTDPFTRGSLSE